MDILNRIEELRKAKGWTSYKLAVEADLSQSTLANMYARGTLPSLTTLINICDALEITLSEFFYESDCVRVNDEEITVKPEERNITNKMLSEFAKLPAEDKKLVFEVCKSLNK